MSELSAIARRLSPSEKLELIGELWEALILEEGDSLPITDDERDELDRRIEEHQRNPDAARPWSEVQARLRR